MRADRVEAFAAVEGMGRWLVLHAHHFEQAIVGWLATKLSPRDPACGRPALFGFDVQEPEQNEASGLLSLKQRINRHATRIVCAVQNDSRYSNQTSERRSGEGDVVYYGFVPKSILR